MVSQVTSDLHHGEVELVVIVLGRRIFGPSGIEKIVDYTEANEGRILAVPRKEKGLSFANKHKSLLALGTLAVSKPGGIEPGFDLAVFERIDVGYAKAGKGAERQLLEGRRFVEGRRQGFNGLSVVQDFFRFHRCSLGIKTDRRERLAGKKITIVGEKSSIKGLTVLLDDALYFPVQVVLGDFPAELDGIFFFAKGKDYGSGHGVSRGNGSK
jgi:hypothetical protein